MKNVNDLFLTTVITSVEDLDSVQVALLESIAGQCALAGGNAVYRARVLLGRIKDTLFVDEVLCQQANPNSEDEEDIRSTSLSDDTIKIYPNPASHQIRILIKEDTKEAVLLTIYNQLGQLVLDQQLNRGINTLDTSQFGKGVYIFKISTSKQKVFTDKVVIIH